MINENSIETVSLEVWNNAQKEELRCWTNEPLDSEDWNSWWSSKFLEYSFLKEEKNIESIYEVGCGPYAKNVELVCKSLGYVPQRVILEDPLLESYLRLNKSVKRFYGYDNVKMISAPMEQFKLADFKIDPVDVVICNNVLDHVQSVPDCFEHMFSSLKDGGIIILGQDLTSADDVKQHSNIIDPCHPIRLDENAIQKYIDQYSTLYKRILSRDEGRNPDYHYATLIFVGRKTSL